MIILDIRPPPISLGSKSLLEISHSRNQPLMLGYVENEAKSFIYSRLYFWTILVAVELLDLLEPVGM